MAHISNSDLTSPGNHGDSQLNPPSANVPLNYEGVDRGGGGTGVEGAESGVEGAESGVEGAGSGGRGGGKRG